MQIELDLLGGHPLDLMKQMFSTFEEKTSFSTWFFEKKIEICPLYSFLNTEILLTFSTTPFTSIEIVPIMGTQNVFTVGLSPFGYFTIIHLILTES